MHGKEWQALNLSEENHRGLKYWSPEVLKYWSWDQDGMSVPDSTLLWNLPKSHCPASDMSVLGKWAQLDTGPVERPGFSFGFASWPAFTGTRKDWCAGHISRWLFQGFFGFAWSILSQKGGSTRHERWMKSGSLTPGKRSPACTALHCSQSDLLLSGAITRLRSGICTGPDVSWEKAIGCTGIQIWKWHLDSGREIQSSPWKTRPLCTLRSYWSSKTIILLAWGKRRLLREETGLIREFL